MKGNFLKSGSEMQPFASSLKTLIIDNNYFFQLDDFPVMPNLQTLSANKNNFNNLEMYVLSSIIAQASSSNAKSNSHPSST